MTEAPPPPPAASPSDSEEVGPGSQPQPHLQPQPLRDQRLRLACVQINGARDPAANLPVLDAFIRQAKAEGAELIATPEVSDMLEPKRALQLEKAVTESRHPVLAQMQGLAAELECWLLLGSLVIRRFDADQAPEALADPRPLANRSFLLGPDGAIRARYDKIHMFDVEIGDGQRYRESETFRPGSDAVLADTPWGKIGLSICYDLRFPSLYRGLAMAGAGLLSAPAAFTQVTGAAHWHVLTRARAIETGCFVFAPAQCGLHAEGRATFGHSMIINPWGEVLAEGGQDPGIISADIDLREIEAARQRIPALQHGRDEVVFPRPR